MGQVLVPLAALIALGGALGVIASRHPIRSALWLVLALSATAVCYLGLGASFAAAAQVVVYVGAIVVLILFAIMLLRLKGASLDRRGAPQVAVAIALGAGLLAALVPALRGVTMSPAVSLSFGSAREAGQTLLGPALLPFELISLLLLAAMVSAIVLGKKGSP
jgi:NADH:ubiquinone oxidoreductase subunit 6 (subunit J)